MQRSRLLPVGENIESWAENWQIASVRVDNPSGAWLQILPLNEYVPPYTNGWIRSFIPSTLNITIRSAISSPSGSLSQFVGNPATVTIYDVAQANSEGSGTSPTGAGARQVTIPPSETNIEPYGTGGGSLPVIPATPNRAVVVRRLVLAPDLSAGLAGPMAFSALISGIFSLSTGGAALYVLAISPEHPFAEATFEDGVFTLPAGVGLNIVGLSENNSGRGYYLVMAQFYREVAS